VCVCVCVCVLHIPFTGVFTGVKIAN